MLFRNDMLCCRLEFQIFSVRLWVVFCWYLAGHWGTYVAGYLHVQSTRVRIQDIVVS